MISPVYLNITLIVMRTIVGKWRRNEVSLLVIGFSLDMLVLEVLHVFKYLRTLIQLLVLQCKKEGRKEGRKKEIWPPCKFLK